MPRFSMLATTTILARSGAARPVLLISTALLIVALIVIVVRVNRQSNQPPDLVGNVPGLSGPGPADTQLSTKEDQALAALGDEVTQAVANGHAPGMIPKLKATVEQHPRYAPLRVMYGQLLLAAGQPAEGYNQLVESLKLDPRQPDLHTLVATIAAKGGQWDKAADHINSAIGQSPRNARYRLLLAQFQMEQNQLEKARASVLAVLAMDSDQPLAYGMMAQVFAKEGKATLALEQIDKAIAHTTAKNRPTLAGFLRQKSMMLRRLNRPAEALQVLTSLTPQERADPSAMAEVADCFGLLNQPDSAALMYQNKFLTDPADLASAKGSALWWIKAGDPAKARDLLARIRQTQPNAPEILDIEKALASIKSP